MGRIEEGEMAQPKKKATDQKWKTELSHFAPIGKVVG